MWNKQDAQLKSGHTHEQGSGQPVSMSSIPGGSITPQGFIQSPNFVTGVSGWRILGDGDAEFNEGTFRGTLTVGDALIVGTSPTWFNVDVDGNMWLGGATFGAAPFSVTNAGALIATNATITGTITATGGAIGGFNIGADYIRDVADSFGLASTVTGGDDVRFWAGDTFANRASAAFRVTEAGVVTASSITISGGSISGVPISGIPNDSSTDISLLEFTHDLVFSVTDTDTIAWAGGTITMSNGRTFSIDTGNTGNMAALTYIYLDPDTSATVLQTTTTYSTAIGADKALIGTAQNNTVTANFVPKGSGQLLVDGANIGALSIVAGNIAASTITAGKLNVSQLSAIAADFGTITSGTVTGATIRTAASGDRFVMTSTAFQGIETGGNVIFEIILTGGDAGDVIMGDDATNTYAKWDDSEGKFTISTGIGTFGGNGADGALSISSGVTNIDLGGAATVVKNYTSISVTGTASITFTNPHANGTIIIFKSQGAVVLTSSATRIIDLRSLGGTAGTGGAIATNGVAGSRGFGTIFTPFGGALGIGGANGAQNGQAEGGAGGASLLSSRGYAVQLGAGAGGAGGGGGFQSGTAGVGGAGGRGAGAVLIECAGALNFTGTVDAEGADGSDSTGTDYEGGGGGGGAGGTVAMLYNSLTANTGTVNNDGGDGGDAITGGTVGGAGGSGNTFGTGAGGGGGAFDQTQGLGGKGGGGGGSAGGGAIGADGGSTSTNGKGTGGGGGGGGGVLIEQNLNFT